MPYVTYFFWKSNIEEISMLYFSLIYQDNIHFNFYYCKSKGLLDKIMLELIGKSNNGYIELHIFLFFQIDNHDIERMQNWLIRNSLNSGCFESVGRVLHEGIKVRI